MMLLDGCGLLVMRADRTIENSAAMVYVPSCLARVLYGLQGPIPRVCTGLNISKQNPAEGYRIIAFLYSTNALLCLPCDDHIIYGETHEYGDDH